jgi:hypothetical protein
MRKIVTHLFSFVLGAALVFTLGSYSINNLRYVFSPAVHFANGSAYKGELNAQGQLHGYGRMVWTNGDEYEGQFSNGLFQGKGKLISKGYTIYEGEFDQGYMSGQGTLEFENGDKYIGQFSRGAFNGKGKLMSADKSVYIGNFLNNEITGKGRWIFSDKGVYRGELKSGIFHGKGKLKRPDGSSYSGEFVEGEMHGLGVYRVNKNVYSGEFVKGQFTGKGVHKDDDANIIKGEFANWIANGKGKKTDERGNEWSGTFENGELTGEGTYVGKDGENYEGEFNYGEYSGKGKLREKNGDEYEGEFRYGSKHGKGVLVYKEPRDGVKKVTGVWKSDNLVESNEVKIYSPADVTDYAIYHQRTAINKSLNAVQASDPNKVELYTLAIAAYGTQEVFRQENKFIENMFNERYNNRTTSIYLTNSQRSLDENPMASLTGIKDSILRLSQQMDKEKDVFFLYITSHGSKDKKISLTHRGMDFGDIDSKWLGGILKSSGIKHKVIVISACYSGGFIDDLKDDNSIIITSASAEKTSFGCADDSEFTYFSKAYFKESLSSDTDFVSAFSKAKDLVAKWEKEEKQTPSDPQIYIAPTVDAYVKAWVKKPAPVLSNP